MPHSRRRAPFTGAGLFAAMLVVAGPAAAAGQRSFVSTSGVDNPACSIASPCRSFGAAITATSPGGEIIVLSSGGYGAVTITQSVSIIASPGVYAGISVSSGDGIVVNAAATDAVTLRGLSINNVGTGVSGIRFAGDGKLQVEDVRVTGFANEGLVFIPATSGDLVVLRSSFSGCGWGIVLTGASAGSTNAVIDHATAHHNVNSGFQFQDFGVAVVRNSVSSYNGIGVWALSGTVAQPSQVSVESSDLSHNTFGALAGSLGLPGPGMMSISNSAVTQNNTGVSASDHGSVLLAGTSISQNGLGVDYTGSGVITSQGNNLLSGNTVDGTAPTVVGSN